MKPTLITLIILFLISCSNSNRQKIDEDESINEPNIILSKIDSLETIDDVQKFVRNYNSDYHKFKLKRIQDFNRNHKTDSITKIIANELGITKTYYKTDFDRNGYTDLLVIGDNQDCIMEGEKSCSFNSLVIMNFGNDSLNYIDIVKDLHTSIVPTIQKNKGERLLVIHNPDQIDWKNEKYKDGSIDTLIYRNGGFIEYNPKVVKHHIERIEFSTGPCLGYCPIFSLSLIKNGKSEFTPQAFNLGDEDSWDYFGENGWNEDKKGKFLCVIKEEKWNELTDLINYIDFTNLKNNYTVEWTDDQSCSLKIVYDNNKTKVINDYGLIGTFGLEKLYQQLFELRFNQDWERID